MTLRSFFAIVLKIFGLLFIKTILDSLPGVLIAMYQQDSFLDSLPTLLGVLVPYIGFAWLFLMRTGWLLDRLNLEFGFSEQLIQISWSVHTMLVAAIFVVGGYLAVQALPGLVMAGLGAVYENRYTTSFYTERAGAYPFLVPVMQLVGGLLLVGYRERLADLVLRNERG